MAAPHRPSPFEGRDADDTQPPRGPQAAGQAHAAAAAAAGSGDGVHETSARLAWEEACEEACEVPQIAGGYSRLLSSQLSFRLSHPRGGAAVEAAEAAQMKRDEAGPAGWPAWRAEAGKLLALAWPISLANLLQLLTTTVGIAYVGRLGSLELSAVVLAVSVFNVTGMSVVVGFTGAVDTLCAQAVGAGNWRAVGMVLQRALLVNTAFCLTIAAAWMRSEPLFLALGQEKELAAAAARYMRTVAPALPFIGVSEACRRTLMAQGIVRPATIATAVLAALAPLFYHTFITQLGLGVQGAALAVVALQAVSALLLAGYTAALNWGGRGGERATWHGWSADALRGWGEYLGLAIPSVIMICMKWWSFEALILQAGWFPDAQVAVAVMGLCSTANSAAFMMVFGLSMAASVRIGNSLGSGCPRGARRSVFVCLALTLAVLAGVVAAMLALQDKWVRLLTNVEAVVGATVALIPIFAGSLMADGVNSALVSLLRGSGKQKYGAFSNIVCFWVIAIPLAHHLAFARGWGLQGLWSGAAAANVLQAGLMLVISLAFDYEGAAAAAAARFALREPLLAAEAGGH